MSEILAQEIPQEPEDTNPAFAIRASQQNEQEEGTDYPPPKDFPKDVPYIYRPNPDVHREEIYIQKKAQRRPILLPVKVQTLNEQVDIKKAKRSKAISHKRRKPRKNHRQRLETAEDQRVEKKILDGFLLLHSCRVKNPQLAVKSKLVSENIVEVEEGDLLFFQSLSYLDISENHVRLEQLVNLKALIELHMQYNYIKHLSIEPGYFQNLEVLSLGFNSIPAGQILQLAQFPLLRVLDLSGNELCILPEDLSEFKKLEELNLSSNNFSSDSVVVEPGKLFKSLSTIPHMKKLNLGHNALSAFHFEYLEAPNLFESLAELP